MRLSPPVVVPRRHPDVVEAELGDERILLHLEDRRLHVLNASASHVWDELDGVSVRSELVVRVADRVGLDPVTIRDQVIAVLEDLRSAGLVIHREEPGRAPGGSAPARMSSPGPVPPPPAGAVRLPRGGSFAAGDARVVVDVCDPDVAELLGDSLAPLRSSDAASTVVAVGPAGGDRYGITVGGAAPVVVGSALAAVGRALAEINELAAAPRCGLALHAGAVALGAGAVLLPAASGRGKSTLTLGLVRAGAAYLTDEVALVVDGAAGVPHCRPFPKSVALEPGSFPLFADLVGGGPPGSSGLARACWSRSRHVDPRRVGTVAGGAVAVAGIVVPSWRAGARMAVHRCSSLEAIEVLLGSAFEGRREVAAEAFALLVRLAVSVPVWRMVHDDLDEAVATVVGLVSGDRGPVGA